MSILNGFKKFKRYLKTPDGFILSSCLTKSQTVEMDDGNTLEENLGGIKGISSSLTTDNSQYALSTSGGKKLQDQINTLNTNMQSCFQSVSDGKAKVASAITDKGVSTASDATFDTMAANIGKIPNSLKVIDLGGITGSKDIKQICANNGINYTSLTANNFAIYKVTGGSISVKNGEVPQMISSIHTNLSASTIPLSYNASNGMVSVSGNTETLHMYDPGNTSQLTWYSSRTLTCYIRLLYV